MRYKLLFIVGSPRSGTTWLQKMIASHPSFVTGQESDFFTTIGEYHLRAYRQMLQYKDIRCGLSLPAYFTYDKYKNLIEEMFYEMINQVQEFDRSKIFLEKTPSHALYIDTIREILPQSKFVLIIRNPFDVVKSMLNASKSWGKGHFPATAKKAIETWYNHNKTAVDSLKKISTDNYRIIRYEALKEDIYNINQIFSLFDFNLTHEEIDLLYKKSIDYKIKIYGEFGNNKGKECIENSMFNYYTRKVQLDDLTHEEQMHIEEFLNKVEMYDEFIY